MGIIFTLSASGGITTPSIISYPNAGALPVSGFEGIELAYTADTDTYYYWDGAAWQILVDNADHGDLQTVIAGLAAHIASTTAHSADHITFTPGSTVAATDVQAAIIEVASEADTRLTALEAVSHSPASIGNFDSTPNAKGMSIAGQAISLAAANSSNPGGLSTGTQSIGGEKDFAAGVNVGSASGLGASELFKVNSTTKGAVAAPAMTTTQKNAISSPSTGLQVYDTVLKQLSYFNGANWENVPGRSTPAAITPAAGTVTPSDYRNQIQQCSGSGGAVAISDILATNAVEGDMITYVGTDSTNTVAFDSGTHVVCNGTCVLGADDMITFIFINAKWREMSRSN